MPEPAVLRRHVSDGQVLVTWGPALVYRYEAEDLGMRNLAIVALTDAGRRVDEVAAVFRVDCDVRVDPAGQGSQGGLDGAGGPPPRPPAQAQRPPGGPGPGVGRAGVDPAGDLAAPGRDPRGDQCSARP